MKEFLGIEIARNRVSSTLRLTQSTYIAKILERFEMSDSNPTATPMRQSSKLTTEDSKALSPDVPYRSAIGSLIYVSDDLHSSRPWIRGWKVVAVL